MKKLVICLAILLSSCEELTAPIAPTEAQMKDAYLQTSDILLGTEVLNGSLQLSEFKRIGCTSSNQGLFRCKFYAKLGVSVSGNEGNLINHFVGSQSGYFREATFFRSTDGKWLCADVVNSSASNPPVTGQ